MRDAIPEGFAVADAPREFVFPADHGPHPEFRTEWWYAVGHLATAEGRRFGFELTIFRQAMAPPDAARPSAWGTRNLHLAHFAVTDIEGGSFHAYERLARGGAGLAGATAEPFRVWVEDWSFASEGEETFPFRLRAQEDGIALDLRIDAGKPPVLQGDAGLSRKGPSVGSASYYYSMTRLPTSGSVTVEDGTFTVEGITWMDREWSTGGLEEHQVGWDWFALVLDDGRELMVAQLRREDGGVDSYGHGSWVEPDGTYHLLDLDAVDMEVLGHWTSPRSGSVYPARWRLNIRSPVDTSPDLELLVEPLLADQELDVDFRYWEGAVDIQGTVTGRGYVELVGY